MNDFTPLFEALRADLQDVRTEMRADIQEVRAEVRALAARPSIPPWVRSVAIAALTTAVTITVTRAFGHVVWTPAPSATEAKR
jgi:hypothetical protein